MAASAVLHLNALIYSVRGELYCHTKPSIHMSWFSMYLAWSFSHQPTYAETVHLKRPSSEIKQVEEKSTLRLKIADHEQNLGRLHVH